MVCPRCGKQNEPDDKYCSRCGLEFAHVVKEQPRSDGETLYCHWHPKEPTQLTCGKCERPVCTKCVIIGPAGVRCKECGRNKVKVSARGLAHDASRPIMQTIGYWARQPFGIIVMIMLCSGLLRGGCMVCRLQPELGPGDYYEQPIEPPQNTPTGMEKA